jgi:hypothetical protein
VLIQGPEVAGEKGLDEQPGSWGMEVVAALAVVGIERQGAAELSLHPSRQGPSNPAPGIDVGNAGGRLVVLDH